ncbi:MAG: hypothetical protein QI197_06045 [Candidatus Korarchaeota archaeon]|nr:hypothetical protein [Candidatus Korarchaeota archaeon]
MLERYLEEGEARRLEMGLLMASLYEKVFALINELRLVEKVVKASNQILHRKFDREISELDYSISSLINEMYLTLMDVGDQERGYERLRKEFEVKTSKLRERIEDLSSSVMREVELAATVLSESMRRMPDAGPEILFLAARLEEIPNKILHMPGSYLDVLLNLFRTLLPTTDFDTSSLEGRVDGYIDALREVYSDLRDDELRSEVRDLLDLLRYLKFVLSKFRQLAPGISKYLEDLRRSSVVFPAG